MNQIASESGTVSPANLKEEAKEDGAEFQAQQNEDADEGGAASREN